MIDFTIPDDTRAMADRITAFVQSMLVPIETDGTLTADRLTDKDRRRLQDLARRHDLFGFAFETGPDGTGWSYRDRSVLFEAAGYSPLAPVALNCAAPDESTARLLQLIATDAQKRQWLDPLIAGDIRSCFAMSERPPGAGADPTTLTTTYRQTSGGFSITGRKWLISGADGAAFCVVMARDEQQAADTIEATLFIVDMESPGVSVDRVVHSSDPIFVGGLAALSFDAVFVPMSSVLGEIGQGFRHAQSRLGAARLAHCMRWLGAARRAHDIATDHARRRRSFGSRLIDHQAVGFALADNEIDIHTSRLLVQHTAWLLDQENPARRESAMAKIAVSEAVYRVADRCIQVLGGIGVTEDTVVDMIFRGARSFRLYDGPSEVHRASLARRLGRD